MYHFNLNSLMAGPLYKGFLVYQEAVPEGVKAPKSVEAPIIEKAKGKLQEVKTDVEASRLEAKHKLTSEQKERLMKTLEERLKEKHVMSTHYKHPEGVDFANVKKALEASPALMWSLREMEESFGKPDVIMVTADSYIFADCSKESPIGHLKLTYDEAAKMAKEMGVDMMDKDTYRKMQELGDFDNETTSWLLTDAVIRKSGMALEGFRAGNSIKVGRVYADHLYHDQGWRGVLKVPRVPMN